LISTPAAFKLTATGTLVNVISPIALAFSALGGDGFLSAFSGTLDGHIDLK